MGTTKSQLWRKQWFTQDIGQGHFIIEAYLSPQVGRFLVVIDEAVIVDVVVDVVHQIVDVVWRRHKVHVVNVIEIIGLSRKPSWLGKVWAENQTTRGNTNQYNQPDTDTNKSGSLPNRRLRQLRHEQWRPRSWRRQTLLGQLPEIKNQNTSENNWLMIYLMRSKMVFWRSSLTSAFVMLSLKGHRLVLFILS